MATISQLRLCPYCSTEILSSEDDRCRNCEKIIKKPTDNIFKSPNYIYLQKHTLLEKMNRDKVNLLEKETTDRDHIIPTEEEMLIVHEAKWYRECLHLDRVATMCDAMGVMQNLLYTRSSKSELGQIINMAIKLGKLAESIDTLFKTGAVTYDREIRPIRPKPLDDEDDNSAASTSRDF